MEQESFQEELASISEHASRQSGRIGFPAILGQKPDLQVKDAWKQRLQRPVFEIPTSDAFRGRHALAADPCSMRFVSTVEGSPQALNWLGSTSRKRSCYDRLLRNTRAQDSQSRAITSFWQRAVSSAGESVRIILATFTRSHI